MKEVRPEIKKIATVTVAIFLPLFAALLFFFGASTELLLPSLMQSGFALTLISMFWFFFIKWGWKCRAFRVLGWLCQTPNLNGRWEGTVCRDGGSEKPHRFILEISQTYTSLKYRTFGTRSGGESISVVLFSKDEQGLMWEAICVWLTKARKIEDGSSTEDFYGTSKWEISIDPITGKKVIKDNYYTSRRTSGRIRVEWVSDKLQGKFE